MVVLLIIAYLFLILIDLPVILKTNQRGKTIIIYLLLLGMGFTLAFLQVTDRAPLSPTVYIEETVRSFLKLGG